MVAGRPPLPLATAIATGAAIKNPGRYRAPETLDLYPLHTAPVSPHIIDDGLVEHWDFYLNCLGWLTEADRRLVEKACAYRANSLQRMRHKVPYIDTDGNTHPDIMLYDLDHRAEGIELRILERLGATPTTRPKVTPPGHKGGPIKRKQDWW